VPLALLIGVLLATLGRGLVPFQLISPIRGEQVERR
jgi:hypothetical protein